MPARSVGAGSRTIKILGEPGPKARPCLEALDLMQGLLRLDRGQALQSHYQEFCELHGRRPLAVEAHQDRYSPRATRGWLAFVRAQHGLEAAEEAALSLHATIHCPPCCAHGSAPTPDNPAPASGSASSARGAPG